MITDIDTYRAAYLLIRGRLLNVFSDKGKSS